MICHCEEIKPVENPILVSISSSVLNVFRYDRLGLASSFRHGDFSRTERSSFLKVNLFMHLSVLSTFIPFVGMDFFAVPLFSHFKKVVQYTPL